MTGAAPPAEPPYAAVVFTSKRAADDADGYANAAAEMERLAAAAPGYLGHRSVRDAAGFGITVSYWRSIDDAERFGRLPAHRAVQREGRAAWYEWYVSEVATVERTRTG